MVLSKTSFPQEKEVNFVLISHDAITFSIFCIKYLLSVDLMQDSFNNAVDIKIIKINDLYGRRVCKLFQNMTKVAPHQRKQNTLKNKIQ